MVVVEGVARKLNPETNIWEESRPILENWLKELNNPINKLNQTISNTSDAIKKLPELPIIIEKANKVISSLAEGKVKLDSFNTTSFQEEELKIQIQRNKLFNGILILVIILLLIF
jgi:ubiquinone biosynthesis protein